MTDLIKSAKISQWKTGADAPAVIMIDDFANKYMIDENGRVPEGGDWGGRCKEPGSFYDLINTEILSDFPYAKFILFLVVGRRAELVEHGMKNVSHRIDEDEKFAMYMEELLNDPRFEMAYHGMEHGVIKEGKFIQEWENFHNLDSAMEKIDEGKTLYTNLTGREFTGGKYCGYKSNAFSDRSISQSGFQWWCRHWDADIFTKKTTVENLDIEFFDGVMDLPSTVDGSLRSLKNLRVLFSGHWKKYLYSVRFFLKYGLTLERIIDDLVKKGRVVSIQEHSSPLREDGIRQTPNIVDDIENLKYILKYLEKYDIWHATGQEITDYVIARENTEVYVEEDVLLVKTDNKAIGRTITVEVQCDHIVECVDENGKRMDMTEKNGMYYLDLRLDRKSMKYYVRGLK